MSRPRRIREILLGLLGIAMCLIMIIDHKAGYQIAMFTLCLTLLLTGLRYIVYYFRMAKHMAGGKSILFIGFGLFDMGLFTFALSDYPLAYIALYLILFYAFSGVIGIMRSMEARRYGASSWKLRFSTGAVNIFVAIFAIIYGFIFQSAEIVTYIYCAGLFYSAIMRIISAIRRSAIVYIS